MWSKKASIVCTNKSLNLTQFRCSKVKKLQKILFTTKFFALNWIYLRLRPNNVDGFCKRIFQNYKTRKHFSQRDSKITWFSLSPRPAGRSFVPSLSATETETETKNKKINLKLHFHDYETKNSKLYSWLNSLLYLTKNKSQ